MRKIFILLLLSLTIFSCSNIDDQSPNPNPQNSYSNGIFILNEGNFRTPNASVSFLSEDGNTFYEDLYKTNNNGNDLGDVAQSMYLSDDTIYIVINNSNVIRIIDRNTFKEIGQINEKLALPRYLTISRGHIYISNASSKSITIYDANTLEYKGKIDLDFAPEQIVSTSESLFVQTDPYNTSGKIYIISTTTNDITETIQINGRPAGIKKYKNFVYALFSNSSESYLYKIDDNGENSFNIISEGNTRNLSVDNDNMYITSENMVHKLNIAVATIEKEDLLQVDANGYSTFYGFNVIDNKIYTSDAKGFTQKSIVKIYDLQGNLLKEQITGIGTNGFYKN